MVLSQVLGSKTNHISFLKFSQFLKGKNKIKIIYLNYLLFKYTHTRENKNLKKKKKDKDKSCYGNYDMNQDVIAKCKDSLDYSR